MRSRARSLYKDRQVVLVDIDGVLADNWPRLTKYIHSDRANPDWDSFYLEIEKDELLEGWAVLVRELHIDHNIVLLTNRPERYRQATIRWMMKHRIPYDALLMRDGLHYNESKKAHTQELLEKGFSIMLAIDDDPIHKEVYTELGIPFLYAHSGYYEMGRIDDNKVAKA